MARRKSLQQRVKAQQAEWRQIRNKIRKQKARFSERGYGTESIDKILNISVWQEVYTASDYTLAEQNVMYGKAIAQVKRRMKNSMTYTLKGYETNMKAMAESMDINFAKARKSADGTWKGPRYWKNYDIDDKIVRREVSTKTMSMFMNAFHRFMELHPEMHDDSDRIMREMHRFAVESGMNESFDQGDIDTWVEQRILQFVEEGPEDTWNPDIDLF